MGTSRSAALARLATDVGAIYSTGGFEFGGGPSGFALSRATAMALPEFRMGMGRIGVPPAFRPTDKYAKLSLTPLMPMAVGETQPSEDRMAERIIPYQARGQLFDTRPFFDAGRASGGGAPPSCSSCETAIADAMVVCRRCRADVEKCRCPGGAEPMMMLPMETMPGQELRPMPMQPGGPPPFTPCPPGFHKCSTDAECEGAADINTGCAPDGNPWVGSDMPRLAPPMLRGQMGCHWVCVPN